MARGRRYVVRAPGSGGKAVTIIVINGINAVCVVRGVALAMRVVIIKPFVFAVMIIYPGLREVRASERCAFAVARALVLSGEVRLSNDILGCDLFGGGERLRSCCISRFSERWINMFAEQGNWSRVVILGRRFNRIVVG